MAPVVGIAGSYTAIPMGLVMVFGEVGAFLSYIRFIAPHHRNKDRYTHMFHNGIMKKK